MSRRLITVTLIFSLLRTTVFAGGFSQALSEINEGDYKNAEVSLKKLIEKEPKNFAVNYLVARFYYQEDNPKAHLDSAYQYALKATQLYPGETGATNLQKYAEAGIRPYALHRLVADICELAYQKADSTNTLEKWESFIQTYKKAKQMPLAMERRNQLAYEQAKGTSKYESFKDFMDRYPNAQQTTEAKKLYESLLYKQTTEPNTWQAYKLFIDKNPDSPYLKEAKDKYYQLFYKDMTQEHTLRNFEDFTKLYSDNPYAKYAQDTVYAMVTRSKTVADYQKFIRNYPNNRNIQQAWRDLFESYTYKRDTQTLTQFKNDFPEYPFPEELEQEITLSKRLLVPYEKGNFYGFRDSLNGQIIIDPMFDEVLPFSEGLAAVVVGKCEDICLHGYVDKGGNLAIKAKYNEAQDFHNGYAIVGMGDCYNEHCKYGYINRWGEMVVPLAYDDAYPFSEGLALVYKTNMGYGFVNEKGRIVIKLQYQDAVSFSEGLAAVETKDETWGFIDKTGAWKIAPEYEKAGQFSEGIAPVQDETGLWGYIDVSGNFVLEPLYTFAAPFQNGTAKVVVMEKVKSVMMQKEKMIDRAGKFVRK